LRARPLPVRGSVQTTGAMTSDASPLSRHGRCIAVWAPAVDAVLCAITAIAAKTSTPAAVGWTMQAPIAVCALRLIWQVVLFILAVWNGRDCMRDRVGVLSKRVQEILAVAFPYVIGLLYVILYIARLIGDPPAATTHLDGVGLWTLSLGGIACTGAETWFTLEALPLVRDWTRRRVDARRAVHVTRLNADLLSVEADDAAGVAMDSAGSTSPLSREEQEAKEKAEKERKEREQRGPTVKNLTVLITPDWLLLIQATILLVLAAVSDTMIPHYIGMSVSAIVKGEADGTLEERPFTQPVMMLMIAGVCSGVFSACRGATFITIGSKVSVRLRHSLFDALASQEIGFFDTTKTGELTSRMTQDCQKVSDQVTLNVNVFLRTLVQTVTTLLFMFTLSMQLTVVAFISVPITAVISKKYGGVMRKLSEKTQKSLADANSVAEEVLSSMSTVRSFAAENLESDRFGTKLQVFAQQMRTQARFYTAYLSSTMILPQAVTALILFYGGKLAMEKQMQASSLLSFVFYLQTLNNSFSTLGDFYTNMVTALGAATRVFELRGREPQLPLGPPDGSESSLARVQGALRVENVRFSYPARPDTEVLKGLSLEVPAGRVVALVGPSGNGKSTIIGLLQRHYKASSGSVTMDGIDIWDFPHRYYHTVISIVGQEPVLFDRTLRENIIYGLENPGSAMGSSVSEQQVHQAAIKANAHDFISNMPEGYATEVGERGVQLSGGQKQRIAIARALVRQPKILLLDEATSALDAESERQVQSAIDGMITAGNMTVIIIAHRLSTVRNSHKICVVSSGQVIEEGTHDELVAQSGAYFKLVECQLRGPEVCAEIGIDSCCPCPSTVPAEQCGLDYEQRAKRPRNGHKINDSN